MSLLPTDAAKDVLQPNEQAIDMDAMWARVRVWVYAGLVVILAVVAALFFYMRVKNQEEAAELAAQTMLIEATSESALQTLIETHPKSSAATQAMVLLAQQKYQETDWKTAREYYQKLYETAAMTYPDLAAAGLFGVGASYEAEKNYDKSLEAYTLMARQFPDSYKIVEAKLGEARIYELKNENDKAIRAYENIIVTYPSSPWKSEAEQRKKSIDARAK